MTAPVLRERFGGSRWRDELRGVEASITFLTRIPLQRHFEANDDDVRRAVTSFPLVGGAVGALSASVATLLATPLGALVASGLGVTLGVLVTGALHLDGLADTADGLGARSRDHALAVMRESTIGAYGVIAIVLDLGLRVALVRALTLRHDAIIAATLAGLLSRATPAVLMSALPYARNDAGIGRPFSSITRSRATSAVIVACAASLVVNVVVGGVAIVVVFVLCVALATFFRRWLGGVTGDVLGASSELSEIAVLLVALAFVSHA